MQLKHTRRGWRETIEPGLYRTHRIVCPRSKDHRPGGRCECPFSLVVPGVSPGSTRSVSHPGPIKDARAERRRLLSEGRPVVQVEPKTLTEFFGAWMRADQRRVSPATLYWREGIFRRQIGPELGGLRLTDITPEVVLGFLNNIAATAKSLRMVTKNAQVLSSCLSTAVRWGRIPANPCAGNNANRMQVGEPTDESEKRVLTPSELVRLFDAVPTPRNRTMVRVAAEAALRRGEIVGLRWSDVDVDRKRIHVRRSVWQDPTARVKHTKRPKGHTARTVPIGDDLTNLLAEWRLVCVTASGGDLSGPVWPGRDGGPVAAETPTQVVERACRRAGLVDGTGRPLVNLHGLRHGCGSIMLMAGVPLIAVSRFLGHANVQITAQVYSHLVSGEEQLRAASDALNGLLATGTLRAAVRGDSADDENGVG
jgi:integrase